MGVPALFRWLSKKYPKIVSSVEEEEPRTVPGQDGEEVELPIDMSRPNPNGQEYDCLYLDMNGIVHPCTHPEGKPAPETEEEMMLEVFLYTERVVNMVRPRRLLMMAIDGVAPRAKMNQQRSRRFRSAQEAKEKEEEKALALQEWKSMGLPVTDEALSSSKKAWDSNNITPGTPFMDLLASSLRYWVAKKMNSDPGWKNLQVIISDASVPGEGEHKIMEYIRRQRSHPEHNPNTKHVIYGLDADLIMLSLATHEPYFTVLREDVFAQDSKAKGCHKCGKEGHIAANCTGEKKSGVGGDALAAFQAKPTPTESKPERKPFIFLDVSILREYLEVELNVAGLPFAFDLERAIDDWVFLIFFVGNDFLPHLPSLEIREGAIDTLLRIWRKELTRMGGYLTKHGQVELKHAQLILDGLAADEDDIFKRRKEMEERQEANQKRRRKEDHERQARERGEGEGERDGMKIGDSTYVAVKAQQRKKEQVIPKPAFNGLMPDVAPAKGGAKDKAAAAADGKTRKGTIVLGGDNNQMVDNRAAIRMANINAAEALKAELAGLSSKKQAKDGSPSKRRKVEEERDGVKVEGTVAVEEVAAAPEEAEEQSDTNASQAASLEDTKGDEGIVPADRNKTDKKRTIDEVEEENGDQRDQIAEVLEKSTGAEEEQEENEKEKDVGAGEGEALEEEPQGGALEGEEDQDEDEDVEEEEEEEGNETVDPLTTIKKRVVKPDGTVEYEDTVKLWEPGYRERYYREKFGVELSDTEFRRGVVKSYVEGLCWVLAYYYQGVPSWQWYYPYHYSPFAADFNDIESFEIDFKLGQPFRPFEQLMGVLPAASKLSLPEPFHELMTEDESEIIDFYPSDFEIDMNGKKMAWQGVALLPFIDERRLLKALEPKYKMLDEQERKRNCFGNNALFVCEGNRLYESLCDLYAKGGGAGEQAEAANIDPSLSGGNSGKVRIDPDCVPGSRFLSPLEKQGLADIVDDRSISVLYDFPEQRTPHRSVLLKGLKPPPRKLTSGDIDWVRRGGPDARGRGRGRGGYHSNGGVERKDLRMGSGPLGGGGGLNSRPQQHQQGGYHDPLAGYGGGYGGYGGGYGGGGAYGGGGGGGPYGSYGASAGQAKVGNGAQVQGGGYGNYQATGAYAGYGAGGGNWNQSRQDAYGTYQGNSYASRGGGFRGGRGGASTQPAQGHYANQQQGAYGGSGGYPNSYPSSTPYGGYGAGSGGGGGGYGGYGVGSNPQQNAYAGGGGGGYASQSNGGANYGGYGVGTGGGQMRGGRGGSGGFGGYRGGARGGRGGTSGGYGGGGGAYGGFY